MTLLNIVVTKGKGTIEVNTDNLPQEVYEEAVRLGLKELINRGMSKITKAQIPDETTRQNEAMLKANANAADLLQGKFRKTGQKAAKGVAGAVMTEARRIARLVVKDILKANKQKLNVYSAAQYTEAANALIASDPSYVKQAEANLAARSATPAGIDLSSILKPNPELVAKAEAKAAKAKQEKGEQLSAKQAGKVQPRAKKGQATHAAH